MAIVGNYEYQEQPLARDIQGVLYSGMEMKTGKLVFIKHIAHANPEGIYPWPEAVARQNLLLAKEEVKDKKAGFLVVERPEGKLLSELLPVLQQAGIFGRHKMLKIFLAVCEAVRELHSQGLVHGSIHPGNILVQPGEVQQVYLMCFHPLEMRTISTDPAENDYLIYLSQEQLRGLGNTASDIYALGILLHSMFGAEPPYAGSSQYELAERVMWGNFKVFMPSHAGLGPPRDLAISPELNMVGIVANKSIQRSPSARFGSVVDLIDILSQVVARLSPTALGLRLFEEGQSELAVAVLEEAVQVEDPAQAYIYLGRIYGLAMGNYDKGVAAFKRALKANPDLEVARLDLARLYSRFGHHVLAKNAYTELLTQRPEDVQLLMGYAKVLSDSDSYEGALNVLSNIQRIAPFHLSAYREAIKIALEHNDRARAESDCNRAIEQILKVVQKGNLNRSEVAQIYFYRATLHRLAGRTEQAFKWLNYTLEQDPKNTASHMMFAEIYQEQGKPEEALQHFLTSLSLDPSQQGIMEGLEKMFGKASE